MQLYLVQHGPAKTEGEDPDRPLTEQGVDDVEWVASRAVEWLDVRPARVLHSGKTRARQTADLWGGPLDAAVEATDGLAPNDDPSAWVDRLGAETDDLMLVGHLPHLDRLAALLVRGDAERSVVRFRPGGLVGLERTEAGWLVSVVLPPRVRR